MYEKELKKILKIDEGVGAVCFTVELIQRLCAALEVERMDPVDIISEIYPEEATKIKKADALYRSFADFYEGGK